MQNSVRVLGIRKENKNKWERRVAITPHDCKKLRDKGYRIILQSNNLRCYTDKQYLDNGVEIVDDLSEADVILGVKEIPLELLIPEKTFIYFSHTFKGQDFNMPALDNILDKRIRLIDYERIRENKKDNPQRLVAFGKYAGNVGTIDFLQGLGEFLLNKELYVPFLHTGFSFMYPSLEHAKKGILEVSNLIKKKKIPKSLNPMIFAITGNGRVSNGSIEILELLPHEWIDPDNLHKLFNQAENVRRDRIYLTKIEHKHMYRRKDNFNSSDFDKNHFYQNKNQYISVFAEKYLQYLSAIFHCMYWDPQSPVIISNKEAYDYASIKKLRLLGITDITCDWPISSIQLLKKLTSIDKPFYTIDPITNILQEDFSKMSENAILYHAVDHLPSELPFDASMHFSEKLLPFLENILNSQYPCDFKEGLLPPEIELACEAWNGKLCPEYTYLYQDLKKRFPKKYQEF